MDRRPRRTPGLFGLLAVLPILALGAGVQAGGPDAAREARAGASAGKAESAQDILSAVAPELRRRLQEERVVLLPESGRDGDAGGMTRALVLFERPRNEVIRFLIQSPRQTEFRPELREARLLEEYEAGQLVEYEIRMMFTRLRYRMRHAWDFRRGKIWWSLDPEFDNDLRELRGRWEVFSLGADRALGRAGILLDIGPALPDFLQDFATRQKLPESMQRVRKWVDSGGTYRP